jgi:hypothetical protein
MNNEANNLEDPFMDIAIKKMENHEIRIGGLEVKAKNQPDHSIDVLQLKGEMSEVKAKVNAIAFPVKEMDQLSIHLKNAITLLQNPVEQKVVHHHYLNKGLWIAIGMFLVVTVLVMLLVNAWSRINENQESDIKYRHLKLYTDKNLRTLMQYEDSIYLADPDMLRKYVIGEETRRKEKAELLLLSKEKEEESKQLKKKAENK